VDKKVQREIEQGLSGLPQYAVAIVVFRLEIAGRVPSLEVLLARPKWLSHFGEWMVPEIYLETGAEILETAEELLRQLTTARIALATNVVTIPRGKVLPGAVTVCSVCIGRDIGLRHRSEDSGELWFCDISMSKPRLAGNYGLAIEQSLMALAANPRDVALLIQNDRFTVAELVAAMNAVRRMAGVDGEVDLRNFRRRLDEADWIEDTGTMSSEVSHRPAKLYRVKRPR
jgi:hypothetical protein